MIKKIVKFWKNLFKSKTKRKIDEFKKNNKKDKENNRNKYNFQLKINFKSKKLKKISAFLLLILLLLLILFFKWPLFKVNEVNIIKLDQYVNSKLIEKQLNKIKWQLLFKIKSDEIKSNIKNIEQNIKNIDIDKVFPSKINIRLTSYVPIFKTSFNDNNYLITENWVFIPTRNKNEKIKTLTIRNLELQNYPNYRKILKEKILQNIVYIKNELEENIVNIKIDDIIYYKISNEVHYLINNKTRLIFDLEQDIDKKLEQIFVFNKEKINIIKPWIIYIDNRVESKVFYCPDTETQQCIENLNYIYEEKLNFNNFPQTNTKE